MAITKKKLPDFPGLGKSRYKNEAINLHRQGFTVVPIKPDSKITATKWQEWEDNSTEEKISEYWDKHPSYEVGIITNANLIVFDADGEQSKAALYLLEQTFDIEPNYIVKTKKGEHHYFHRPDSVYAKQDSFDSDKYPDRIDIKTDRSLVIAPPSGGKEVLLCEIEHINELSSITQEFIDAMFKHNGRDVPKAHKSSIKPKAPKLSTVVNHSRSEVNAYLEHIDSDCGYEDWRNIGMALHHDFNGSNEGLEIFDEWSSKGSKYTNSKDIQYKWTTFEQYKGAPITIATIVKMASDNGADIQDIQNRCAFDVCEMEVVQPNKTHAENINVTDIDDSPSTINPLTKYSLTGKSQEFLSQMRDDKFVLDKLALQGQWMVCYAQYNTGKTLIFIKMLLDSIQSNIIDGNNVYYINADDTHPGLTDKLQLAEEYGFHMLAPGYDGFNEDDLLELLLELVSRDEAKNTIIVLDTLKKFVNVMSKDASSSFGKIARKFIAKGGTLLCLAHVNKKLGPDGSPVHEGVGDIINDADCVYILKTLLVDTDAQIKTVEFEMEKSRGKVARTSAFQYSIEEGLNYSELLASVEPVDSNIASELRSNVSVPNSKSEADLIDGIKACISEGINTKMKLAQAASETKAVSKRSILNLIKQYTGTDPNLHQWNFKRGERGAQVFYILETPVATDELPKPEILGS